MSDAEKEAFEDFKESMRTMNAKNARKTKKAHYPNQVSDSDKLEVLLADIGDIKTTVEQTSMDVNDLAGDIEADADADADDDEFDFEDEFGLEGDGEMPEKIEELDLEFDGEDELTETEEETGAETVTDADTDADADTGGGAEGAEGAETGIDADAGEGDGDVSDSEDEDENVVTEVSKKNFDALTKMAGTLIDKVNALEAKVAKMERSNRLIKAKLMNGSKTGGGMVNVTELERNKAQAVSKSAIKTKERVIVPLNSMM